MAEAEGEIVEVGIQTLLEIIQDKRPADMWWCTSNYKEDLEKALKDMRPVCYTKIFHLAGENLTALWPYYMKKIKDEWNMKGFRRGNLHLCTDNVNDEDKKRELMKPCWHIYYCYCDEDCDESPVGGFHSPPPRSPVITFGERLEELEKKYLTSEQCERQKKKLWGDRLDLLEAVAEEKLANAQSEETRPHKRARKNIFEGGCPSRTRS